MSVSVVLPVWNGAAHLDDAVASVRRQTGTEIELLIHDDGSTDATPQLIAALAAGDPRVDASRSENTGPASSRNRLLARAHGQYVAFLDHDDLWPAGRLARQLAALRTVPDAPGVLGETILFESLDATGAPAAGGRGRQLLCGLLGAGLFRRSAVEAAGPFAPELPVADDVDFLLRLIETGGPLAIEPDVALWYRLRPGQHTEDLAFSGQGTARAVARSLRRRRARGESGELTWRR